MLVLYYNKPLLEANGWQPPTTIEELTVLAESISAADIIPFAHANAEWRPANEWFVGEFLNHVAGPDKVYQALKGELGWENPDSVTAINLLNEYQQNGHFMGLLLMAYAIGPIAVLGFNSVILVVSTVIAELIFAGMGAYSLARFKPPGENILVGSTLRSGFSAYRSFWAYNDALSMG